MQAVTKRTFTTEFRVKAVKLVAEQGLSQSAVSRRLNVPYQTLFNWVKLSKAVKLSSVDVKRITPVSPLEAENSRLRKELAVLKEERDILMARGHPEKATAFFAKESR